MIFIVNFYVGKCYTSISYTLRYFSCDYFGLVSFLIINVYDGGAGAEQIQHLP